MLLAGAEVGAVPLLDGFGGRDGYGMPDHCVAAGNDNSYAAAGSSEPTPIDLASAFPEGVRFFGRSLTRFYLNTNGNITFAAPLAEPNATPFPVADQPMIAPWWADVDTRGGGSVCYHLAPGLLVVTWHDVGSVGVPSDRRNDFQLVLSSRPACDYPGELNLYFRFNRCEWTGATVAAQVGFDAGNRANYVALPMSRTDAIAEVCRFSNRADGPSGFFHFDLNPPRLFPVCAAGYPCSVPGQTGLCAAGVRRCNGDQEVCVPRRSPEARHCDGLDHDCDGLVDDACPVGQVCDRARCLARCGPANPCPAGTVCTEGGGCIEAACFEVACQQGEHCVGGRCASVCEGVTCRRGQHCVLGRCVDLCTEAFCESPSFCDDDPTSPTSGRCIVRCECERCSDGRTCGVDGRCVAIVAPDAGSVADVSTDLGLATDVAPAVRGRLVDAGCGCRANAYGTRRSVGAVALVAALLARRRRRWGERPDGA